jgi:hypothetical protein
MSIAAPAQQKWCRTREEKSPLCNASGEIGEHRSYRAKSEFSHGQQARQNSSMQVGVEVFGSRRKKRKKKQKLQHRVFPCGPPP